MFLEEHSLNLYAFFFLGAVNLPHGGVGLFAAISLGRMNLSHGEFILPFRESFISLENRLCYSVSCCTLSLNFSLMKDLYKL